MRITTPFAPIEIGEADYFAFDFMADVGAATIVSTSWNCALGPYETAIDPRPQSRVLSVYCYSNTFADGRIAADADGGVFRRLNRGYAGLGSWR